MSENCIICGGRPGLYFEDFKGNKVCVHHSSIPHCGGCGAYITDLSTSKWIEKDEYICINCQHNHICEHNLKQFIRQTLDILYSVGFQDIQRDWVIVKLISRQEMNAEVSSMTALGFHTEISPSQLSIRGRSDFNQKVCILNYLSPIEFMQVFAHEILHAWQLQNNLKDYNEYSSNELAKYACEGFAQLGSYIIYDYFDSPKFNSEIRTFVQYKKKLMLNNSDEVYGIPFRKILGSQLESDKTRWLKLIKAARLSQIKEFIK